jgi:hypothetical protein
LATSCTPSAYGLLSVPFRALRPPRADLHPVTVLNPVRDSAPRPRADRQTPQNSALQNHPSLFLNFQATIREAGASPGRTKKRAPGGTMRIRRGPHAMYWMMGPRPTVETEHCTRTRCRVTGRPFHLEDWPAIERQCLFAEGCHCVPAPSPAGQHRDHEHAIPLPGRSEWPFLAVR